MLCLRGRCPREPLHGLYFRDSAAHPGTSDSWGWGRIFLREKEGQLFKSCIIFHTLDQESWFGQGGTRGSFHES